jgi:hypothetical protein
MTDNALSKPAYKKVFFDLEQDESGYPPFAVESMWAVQVGPSTYKIDNIPFFARGVSPDDIVEAIPDDEGVLQFSRVIEPSASSVVRVIFFDVSQKEAYSGAVRNLGCHIEGSGTPGHVAIEIPPGVQLEPVLDLLKKGESLGILDYEEASLRHDTSGGRPRS